MTLSYRDGSDDMSVLSIDSADLVQARHTEPLSIQVSARNVVAKLAVLAAMSVLSIHPVSEVAAQASTNQTSESDSVSNDGVEANEIEANGISGQEAESGKEESNALVTVGIQGHYRVGRITAIRISKSLSSELSTSSVSRSDLGFETLDGDGVRVVFGAYPSSESIDHPGEVGYAVPGSEAAPLTVRRVADQTAAPLVSTRFPLAGVPSKGPSMIPPAMPWVVSIGDPLGIEEIGLSNVLADKTGRIAVTRITDSANLPFHSLGFDGVNLVMISASGLSVLERMTDQQSEALTEWVKDGGHLFVCLGESTETISQTAPWLVDLLPIEDAETVSLDPAALETFTSSQSPLKPFKGIRLPRREGRPGVLGRTTRRVSAVLAADYVVGFGQVSVVTADLDRGQFVQWPERLELVTRLIGDVLADPDDEQGNSERTAAFSDLSGQMRGVLDQFPIKPSFSFSLISLIVMLLIAAIGPLDFLLINRVLGRPLLGWLSFPLVAIGLSCVLVSQAEPNWEASSDSTTDLLRANQLQVTDLDLIGGTGRSFAWASLYSHHPVRTEVNYVPAKEFGMLELANQDSSKTFAFPMGYPGRSFGGVQLAGESQMLAPYSMAPTAKASDGGSGVETVVKGLTIALGVASPLQR